MFKQLDRLMEEEKWEEARVLVDKLEKEQEPSDVLAVYNAAVYLGEGKTEEARQCITVGIICNPANYELYYLLGNSYLNQNVNQAYLCYEQALFYCEDKDAAEILKDNMSFVSGLEEFEVHKVSVVILSCHNLQVLEQCVESIRKNCNKQTYELIVADYSLEEGVAEWLKDQKDIVSCCYGMEYYSARYNRGIAMADSKHDIFLLDSNTIVPSNVLFWLRMGLYERKCTGAVCPLSNSAKNHQKIKLVLNTAEEYLSLAESIHIPMPNPYENKIYAVDSAVLIKRRAFCDVGWFDERYGCTLGDMDYGMSMSVAGYEILLCNNAFVYHNEKLYRYGETAEKSDILGRLDDKQKLLEKWGFDPVYYMNIREEMVKEITEDPDTRLRVLEVGCGCGCTLSHIRWKYPNAEVYGIETVESAAKLGRYMANILVDNVETMEFPYVEKMFDYVIFGDVLEHLRDPYKVLSDLKRYICPDGKILASIPNLLNGSVIAPLLRGKFTYKETGLLDKTHIHLFTKYEIEKMFLETGFQVEKMFANTAWERDRMEDGDKELIDALCALPGVVPKIEFEAYQYFIVAKSVE